MGLGDAKLMLLAGAWFGVQGAVFTLFAASVQGTLAALIMVLIRGKLEEPAAVRAERKALQEAAAAGDEQAKQVLEQDPLGEEPNEGLRKSPIPFGPFLVLACLEYLFWGDAIRPFKGWGGLF